MLLTLALLPIKAAQAFNNEIEKKGHHTQDLLSDLLLKVEATTKAINRNEIHAGKDAPTLNYAINIPATSKVNLGLELGIEDVSQGLTVLAVSDDSIANQLNIVAGDKIVSVNYFDVNEDNKDIILDMLGSLSSNKKLIIDVKHKKAYSTLEIDVHQQYLPAVSLTVGSSRGDRNMVSCMREDCIESFRKYLKVAKSGDVPANNLLATMYFYGFGTPKSTKKALQHFHKIEKKRSSTTGSNYKRGWNYRAITQYQLGLIYLTEPDFINIDKALRYFKKAVNGKNADAAFVLSMLHFNDAYQRYNPEETAKWLIKAYKYDHQFTRSFAENFKLTQAFESEDEGIIVEALLKPAIAEVLSSDVAPSTPAMDEFERAINQYMVILNKRIITSRSNGVHLSGFVKRTVN